MVWFSKIIALYIIICQVIRKVFGREPYLNQQQIFVIYDEKIHKLVEIT